MNHRILVINPGSVSTKIAVYENIKEIFSKNIEHSVEELKSCKSLLDQYPLRKNIIVSSLEKAGINLKSLSAIAARGGTFGKLQGGAYLVDENLVEACKKPLTEHASNLAAIIAYDISKELNIKSYIYDAVCVDETDKIASYTGLKDVKRKPNSHVLNSRAVCREVAKENNQRYEDLNFVVAHIGGGLSINVHRKGKISDVISDDEGPMSPERAGCINTMKLVDLCYSGKYTKIEMKNKLKGFGGLVSHLNTNSAIEVEKMIEANNQYAKEIYETMAYQIAKGIGALATTVNGDVDFIILTGGVSYSKILTNWIKTRVKSIAPVKIIPGTREMEALALGIIRVLEGEEKAKLYNA